MKRARIRLHQPLALFYAFSIQIFIAPIKLSLAVGLKKTVYAITVPTQVKNARRM